MNKNLRKAALDYIQTKLSARGVEIFLEKFAKKGESLEEAVYSMDRDTLNDSVKWTCNPV